MCSDISRETRPLVGNDAARPDTAGLARELRSANADYRSLALHAGALHSLTLEAKRRVECISAKLCAEAKLASVF